MPQLYSAKIAKRTYSDIFRMLALSNAHHPQEFVDVITGVTDDTAKNYEDIVDIKRTHYLVCSTLI